MALGFLKKEKNLWKTLKISCNLIMIQESEAWHRGGAQLVNEDYSISGKIDPNSFGEVVQELS